MIRKISIHDRTPVIDMMRVFYASDAVSTNGSEEIFQCNLKNAIDGDPFVEGYVFEDNGTLQGFAFLAKSYSTEFGKRCIWLEDLYIREDHRGLGLAKEFLDYISQKYPDCLIRLEVEDFNERAIKVYTKSGFGTLPYVEMIKFNQTKECE